MKDNLGALLKKSRNDKNLTKEELAKKLGTNAALITKWEKNIGKPSFSHLLLLVKELDLSFEEVILGHEINKENKKESEQEIKKIVKKNIKYKNIFNVFAGIFVCLCLCFLEAVLFKYQIINRDANYIILLVILMICLVGISEVLEKANLLEEKNKYREYAVFLILGYIFAIAGFVLYVIN